MEKHQTILSHFTRTPSCRSPAPWHTSENKPKISAPPIQPRENKAWNNYRSISIGFSTYRLKCCSHSAPTAPSTTRWSHDIVTDITVPTRWSAPTQTMERKRRQNVTQLFLEGDLEAHGRTVCTRKIIFNWSKQKVQTKEKLRGHIAINMAVLVPIRWSAPP